MCSTPQTLERVCVLRQNQWTRMCSIPQDIDRVCVLHHKNRTRVCSIWNVKMSFSNRYLTTKNIIPRKFRDLFAAFCPPKFCWSHGRYGWRWADASSHAAWSWCAAWSRTPCAAGGARQTKMTFSACLDEKKLLAPCVHPSTVQFASKTWKSRHKRQFLHSKNLAKL